MDQNQPTSQPPQVPQTKKTPIAIKIMAGILLFIGLGIGLDVLSSITAIFLGGWMLALGVVALILFIFTEKTAIGMFKLKPTSKRNYYIVVALDMLYLSAKSSMGIFLLAQKTPPVQTILSAIIVAVIGFAILALPFFLITRKYKELYA